MGSFTNYRNTKSILRDIERFYSIQDSLDKRGAAMAEEIDFQLRKKTGYYYDLYKLGGKERAMIDEILSTYQKYSAVQDELGKKIEEIAKKNQVSKETVEKMAKAYANLAKAKKVANESPKDNELQKNLKAAEKQVDDFGKEYPEVAKALENNKGLIEANSVLGKKLSDETQRTADAASRYSQELDIANERLRKGQGTWGKILIGVTAAVDAVKQVGSYWMQVQDKTFKVARQMGLSREQAEAMTKAQLQMTKELAFEYGVTQEQLLKFQETYTQQTGKAVQLTKGEIESMTVMSKLGSDEQAAQWAVEMSKYGKGIEETAGEFVLIQDKAKALGLNASKATETIAKNLHLANSYTFKNGSAGIADMALKAQSLRIDMEKMMGTVDQFQTIQGSIESSANLQMLGGGFAAQFSNPMGAMYDALNDPEALMDKVAKAVAGYATFDKKSGEAKISNIGMQYLKAAADALHVDRETLSQMAKSQVIGKEVEGAMGANAASMDEQHMAQIKNLAHRNAQGQWVITDYNEKGQENGEISVDKITPKDLDRISQVQPEEKDMFKDVHNIDANVAALAGGKSRAEQTVSAQEQYNGFKEGWTASGANQMNGIFKWIAGSFNNGIIHTIAQAVIQGGIFSLAAGKFIKYYARANGMGSLTQGAETLIKNKTRRVAADRAGFVDEGGIGGRTVNAARSGVYRNANGRVIDFDKIVKGKKGGFYQKGLRGSVSRADYEASRRAAAMARYERMYGHPYRGHRLGARARNAFSNVRNATRNVYNSAKGFTQNIFNSSKNLANGAANTVEGATEATTNATAKKATESVAKAAAKNTTETVAENTAKSAASAAVKDAAGAATNAAAKVGIEKTAQIGAKAVGKMALKGVGTIIKGGGIPGLVALGTDMLQGGLRATGALKEGSTADKSMNVLSQTASYASMGAMLGNLIPIPGVGAGIGGLIGGTIGAAKGIYDNFIKDPEKEKQEKEAKIFKGAEMGATTLEDPELMQKAALATISIHDILATKFQKENGLNADGSEKGILERTGDVIDDITNIPGIKQIKNLFGYYSSGGIVPERAATGRIVGGDSYTGDKVPVMANSGEMILNKSEQNQMFKALSVGSPTISPISSKPYSGKETIRSNSSSVSSYAPQIGPSSINLNVSGTIRLDLGGKQSNIDANKLLNSSTFKDELARIISKQLNTMGNGGKYNKEGSVVNTQKVYNRIR